MSYLVIDIETDSLDINNTHIFCICCIDDKNNEFVFTEKESNYLDSFISLCKKYDYIVAHNGVRFDFPVLQKYGFKFKVRDTLLDSKLIYPKTLLLSSDSKRKDFDKKLIGSYSLKAFGARLGNYKINFNNFTELSNEMIEYCLQDCKITKQLFNIINSSPKLPNYSVLYTEYKVAYLMLRQELSGFEFNIVNAVKLVQKMIRKQNKIKYLLNKQFPPKLVPVSTNMNPKIIKRNNINIVGPYTTLKIQEFNPSSRKQILERLKSFKPNVFTEKLTPVINSNTIKNIDCGRLLSAYLKLNKDISQLYTGANSIINNYNKLTKKIHGKIDTLSCVTHRMSHTSPNITQIPKTKEIRELFHINGSNYIYIGIDADALELMLFGHYLSKYGNNEYIASVAKGTKEQGNDIHTKTQKLIGLPTRDKAKTFSYSILYGGGNLKIGKSIYSSDMNIKYSNGIWNKHKKILQTKIVNNNLIKFDKNTLIEYDDELIKISIFGEQLKNKFMEGTLGFKELLNDLNNQYKKYKGYIKTLDNRLIFCESKHKILNSLLQSSGAIFMKYYLVEVFNSLSSKYKLDTDYSFICNIHDAIAIKTKKQYSDDISLKMENAFTETSNKFNFLYPIKGKATKGYDLYKIFI